MEDGLIIDCVNNCCLFIYFQFTPQIQGKSYELLNKLSGNGLSATYKFTRTISIFSPKMVSIELCLTNGSDNTLSAIKLEQKVSAWLSKVN